MKHSKNKENARQLETVSWLNTLRPAAKAFASINRARTYVPVIFKRIRIFAISILRNLRAK